MVSPEDKADFAFTTSYAVGEVGVIVINNAPLNRLDRAVVDGVLQEVVRLDARSDIQIIAVCGINGVFATSPADNDGNYDNAVSISPVLQAIASAGKPVLALIDGKAEDGGLALALACDWRIASARATAALPCTLLGIVPGGGVTQLLPRLTGTIDAIKMVAQPAISAAAALQSGLFDEVLDTSDLVASVVAKEPVWHKRHLPDVTIKPVTVTDIETASRDAVKRGKGSNAVLQTVDLMRSATALTFAEGLEREELSRRQSLASEEAKALRYLVRAEVESARGFGGSHADARPVKRVAVIGGGTMGSGIAVALAVAGLQVDIIEQSAEAASAGNDRVEAILQSQVKAGRVSEEKAEAARGRFEASDVWERVGNADLVIEAAFEDMDVKRTIFERLDMLARPGAVLATNTSYLDVDAIAAMTERRTDVLGLHFFSPAHVMRLLEVVKADATSQDVLATGMALGLRIGKLPVVAGVCDGFIGNRIFSTYRRHAEYLLEDGASPGDIDAAVEEFGFAMGPFAVADMSGLDIAWAMRKRRAATRNPGERYVAIPDRLCEMGRLGRKAGKGWYDYPNGKPLASDEVSAIIVTERKRLGRPIQVFSCDQIQLRLLSVMVNEGAKVLEEKISPRASDIDLVFVNGYGFPRLKGGPMFTADRIGLPQILEHVIEASAVGGAGSEPSALLVELATSGRSFQDWQNDRQASSDQQGRVL
ncbi:enoyl-CoA hydratase [Rhizobium wenxiniae]|uniref:3-hydroxyacyl-CoA dehydrogenase n=1 Tax=Rhizobium wenxiniae TaxID=1737357 RepID=A0A7X0D2B5_9HYPH|nr:FAD-dependent oxidoreductase [Rhizobium wenxiniae]MBB6165309.1 3-hydroxyacyl-CoA dehydrogenase [Rhizobium wenxiniae]GGG14404.1 enoyl-CoA hydratase [Rhizobium wenxiniae]